MIGQLGPDNFLFLSAVLFIIGFVGVLTRRNVLVILMSVELMMNAVNVAFIGFAWEQNSMVGEVFALFIIGVAAAEAVVGLGIVMALSRRLDTVDINEVHELRE
ncbi:MAG TPA: NADH-quinone oxidoreductase subunit NuoK [Thermomicrobiaceae bacterium]|nr:NADH-quinone oxidoreductase subunit NuoK [Thermomicrobiaceae bacterium]